MSEIMIVLGIMLVWGVISWALDTYAWNGGVCRRSGEPWQHFDTDSQGGRGYKDTQGNTCWISWPWVDRR